MIVSNYKKKKKNICGNYLVYSEVFYGGWEWYFKKIEKKKTERNGPKVLVGRHIVEVRAYSCDLLAHHTRALHWRVPN